MEKGNGGPPEGNFGGYAEPAPPYTPMPLPGQQIPQPGFNPSQPYPPTQFYSTQQTTPVVHVVQVSQLRGESTRMTCPHCRAEISTRVKYETGRMTHLAALLLCLVGFWPCACIPYCSEGCMDADHECPNCNNFIGSYRR